MVLKSFFEKINQTFTYNHWVFVSSFMKPHGSLKFLNTHNWQFLESNLFQIPKPSGSLILKIFKYPRPIVL